MRCKISYAGLTRILYFLARSECLLNLLRGLLNFRLKSQQCRCCLDGYLRYLNPISSTDNYCYDSVTIALLLAPVPPGLGGFITSASNSAAYSKERSLIFYDALRHPIWQ